MRVYDPGPCCGPWHWSGLPPATAQARTGAVDTRLFGQPNCGPDLCRECWSVPQRRRFQVRGRDLTLWLAEDAIWLTVLDQSADTSAPSPGEGVNIKLSFPRRQPACTHGAVQPPWRRTSPSLLAVTGRSGGPTCRPGAAVRYVDLYPGIDLELTGEQGQLVPRLSAAPGADLSAVRLRVEGADAVVVEGDIVRLTAAAGRVAYTLPLLRAEGSTGEASVQPFTASSFDVTTPFAPAASSPQPAIANPRSRTQNYHPESLRKHSVVAERGWHSRYASCCFDDYL